MLRSRGGYFAAFSRDLYLRNASRNVHHSCKILVVGGGTGGCTMAAKFAKKFNGPKNQVVVIEPSDTHYYQPMFTLIGGGIKPFGSSHKPMKDVLPKNAKWIKDSVIAFDPEANKVTTSGGDSIGYEIMILALGLHLHWDKIPGLIEALKNPSAPVCSIYGADTVTEVFNTIEKAKDGTAIFTFPSGPVKCPGAPQKIAYIAEEYWCRNNKRQNIDVVYNTALPVIFGVKRYADALWGVCKQRGITVNLLTNLVEIRADSSEAVFQNMQNPDEKTVQKFSFLHVCPPMGPPDVLKQHNQLTNEAGFVTVDQETLRHDRYSNIYGIGDCTSSPNSKTMAAISSQSKVVYRNILADLAGQPAAVAYNGYASCPLVTGRGKCILAEFDYKLQPLETFPIDQAKEYYVMYWLKKTFFPFLYWNFMLKGNWEGPEVFRNYLNLFAKKKVTP